jgi:hypothetical protein
LSAAICISTSLRTAQGLEHSIAEVRSGHSASFPGLRPAPTPLRPQRDRNLNDHSGHGAPVDHPAGQSYRPAWSPDAAQPQARGISALRRDSC